MPAFASPPSHVLIGQALQTSLIARAVWWNWFLRRTTLDAGRSAASHSGTRHLTLEHETRTDVVETPGVIYCVIPRRHRIAEYGPTIKATPFTVNAGREIGRS
jgi:hypothetical protein